jgi:hypothetical protein
MEMQFMGADQFEAVANLTLMIYAKKDALTIAKTLAEKVALKKEIQQLVAERTRLSLGD